MITRLAHVNILTQNLAATEHFYCDILGLEKGFDFLREDTRIGFYINVGNTTFIEVFDRDQPPNSPRPWIDHLCLEVDDLDALIADVRSKGGDITDKKMGCDQSWQAWMTDPDGVKVELMQYTPESTQFTGKPCMVDW